MAGKGNYGIPTSDLTGRRSASELLSHGTRYGNRTHASRMKTLRVHRFTNRAKTAEHPIGTLSPCGTSIVYLLAEFEPLTIAAFISYIYIISYFFIKIKFLLYIRYI